MTENDHAVAVLAVGENLEINGFVFTEPLYVFVIDPLKPRPHYIKLSGGEKADDETPQETAARELEEETGLVGKPDEFEYLDYEQATGKNPHKRIFYRLRIRTLARLKERGDEGEIPGIYTRDDIERPDFFGPHKKRILKFL